MRTPEVLAWAVAPSGAQFACEMVAAGREPSDFFAC